MGEWTTLSVKQNTVDHLKEAKPENMSWNEFLHGVTDDDEIAESAGDPEGMALNEEVIEKLDRLEEAIKEATNAAQSADRKLENMGGR